MVKRVTITLNIREGKPEGMMTIVPENMTSKLEILFLLNEAVNSVLQQVAESLAKKQGPIHVVDNSIKVPQ